jgi:hypothetical protein
MMELVNQTVWAFVVVPKVAGTVTGGNVTE